MSSMNEETKKLLLGWRQTLLMQLGLLETILHLPRSVQPKHRRQDVRQTTAISREVTSADFNEQKPGA